MKTSKWIPSGFAVLAEWHIYGSSIQGRVGIWKPEKNRDTSLVADTIFTRILTMKEYELKDHLGNVTVVISDLKTATTGGGAPYPFGVDVKSFSHYYPFGMFQPGAFGSNREYRFGYNGKESDNDWKGEGNVYDYGFRVYDPRIAKFLSVDPLAPDYPSWSPYAFAMDRPIDGVDMDGLEYLNKTSYIHYESNGKTVLLTIDLNKLCRDLRATVVEFSKSGKIPQGRLIGEDESDPNFRFQVVITASVGTVRTKDGKIEPMIIHPESKVIDGEGGNRGFFLTNGLNIGNGLVALHDLSNFFIDPIGYSSGVMIPIDDRREFLENSRASQDAYQLVDAARSLGLMPKLYDNAKTQASILNMLIDNQGHVDNPKNSAWMFENYVSFLYENREEILAPGSENRLIQLQRESPFNGYPMVPRNAPSIPTASSLVNSQLREKRDQKVEPIRKMDETRRVGP